MRRGQARPQSPHFWYLEGALHVKKKLKRGFVDVKQKKETRSKGIYASQLTIRNLNDVTGKHLNIHHVLLLSGFP